MAGSRQVVRMPRSRWWQGAAIGVVLALVATDASASVPEPEAADMPWVESDSSSVGEVLDGVVEGMLGVLPDVEDEGPDAPDVDEDAEEWDEPLEPPECVDEAASAAEAFWIAAECDIDVLIADEVTEYDTPYATAQGRYKVATTSDAVRAHVSGQWLPVDPTLVADDTAGGYTVAAPVVEMWLAENAAGGEPFAEVATEAGTVELSVPWGLGSASVEQNRATYPVLDADGVPVSGAELVVRIHPDATGLTPVLQVADADAAAEIVAEAASAVPGFEIVVGDGLDLVEREDAAGFDVMAADATDPVLVVPTALQWDSAAGELVQPGEPGDVEPEVAEPRSVGEASALTDAHAEVVDPTEQEWFVGVPESDGVGDFEHLWDESDRLVAPVAGDRVSEMPTSVDGAVMRVSADLEVLADPDTVFPVYIDPSVVGNRNKWTTVRSGWPTSSALYNVTGNQGVGMCDPTWDAACERYNVQRILWNFNEMPVLKDLKKSEVLNASFRLYGVHSHDCSGWSLQLWQLTEGLTAGTTWNNQPMGFERSDSQYPSHRPNCAQKEGYQYWDATKAVRQSTGGEYGRVFLGLKAATETSMTSWRRYRIAGRLEVEYDRAPSAPTGLRVTDPSPAAGSCGGTAWINGATPQLRAKLSDPDGQSLRGDFELFDGSTRIWNPERTSAKSSGSEHVVRVPAGKLKTGKTYTWKVYAYEPGYKASSPVATCKVRVNDAPDVPVASGVSPAMTCGAWYRSATPTLGAYATDPDGQKVELAFSVYQGSTRLWASGYQSLLSSGTGSKTTVNVPSGVLADGGSYRWVTRARDQYGLAGDAYECTFKVDTVKPNVPTITATTPQAGHAQYLMDAETGGVGVPGRFTFGANGSSDTTKYEYSFGTAAYDKTATPSSQGGSATITYTPTEAGTLTLYVRAVDRAGWKSSGRSHRIVVAEAREDGIWTFDEVAGKALDSSSIDGHRDDLTLTGGAERALSGPHETFGSRDGDRAFQGNGSSSVAASDGPVIDNRESFVISAHVLLDGDAAGNWGTALSQDGTRSGGFRLGYRPPSAACPTDATGCWLFGMNTSDGAGTTYVYSDVPVRTDQWVHLTGAYDAGTGQAQLWVCEAGTPDRPARGEPVKAAPTQVGAIDWKASGPFTVGRGKVSGNEQDFWDGQLDNVRVFKGQVVAEAKIRRICQGAEAHDFATGDGALNPTIEIDD